MKQQEATTILQITGMHCAACDVLVKTKLESSLSIISVTPDQKNKTITVIHTLPLTLEDVNNLLCEYGYKVHTLEEAVLAGEGRRVYAKEAFVYILIVSVALYIANDLKIIPNFATDPSLGLGSVFLLGLVASISTCMATTGALLAGYIHMVKNGSKTNLLTGIFLIGRLTSYLLFGFLVGLFSNSLSTLTGLGGMINIFVGLLLVVVALDMFHIVSLNSMFEIIPGFSRVKKSFLSKGKSEKSSNIGSFILGFSTYLLPCGFSLTTQAYALSSANPWQSATIMFVFALGTAPALFALGHVAKMRNTGIYKQILKVIGAVVFIVGISYLLSSAKLYGLTISNNSNQIADNVAPIENGFQVARMTATASGYSPNTFVVKKDIPVKWMIDGKEIFGCQGTLQSPKAGIKLTFLKQGANLFEFVPRETGEIQFSCSMGMFGGHFKVI